MTATEARDGRRGGTSAGGVLTLGACDGAARTGVLRTAHGDIRLPAFMPVGTHATVKACHPDEVRAAGCDVLLCNAYHLALRPGVDLIERAGGLHRFMGWEGPILTDSGGFQVVSLGAIGGLDDDGVEVVSPYDGSRLRMTPELAMQVQARLGADIVMALDQPVGFGTDAAATREATERTHRWAERCRAVELGPARLRFGIVQGGFCAGLRAASARSVVGLDFDGVAIGGLALGEPPPLMEAMARAALAEIPDEVPRYLMGLGSDAELLAMVSLGVDMFDCVLPTRLARTGTALTSAGRVVLRRAAHREDPAPLEEGCPCPACARFSRAYLRHLHLADELLAHRLLSLHNLTHLTRLMDGARAAIAAGGFDEFRAERLARLAGARAAGEGTEPAADAEVNPPASAEAGPPTTSAAGAATSSGYTPAP